MAERFENERSSFPWKKWMVLDSVLCIFALFLLLRFYHTVQLPNRVAVEQAKQKAMKQLPLQEITSSERFVGDRPYTVLHAVYEGDVPVVVWLWEDGIHVENQSDGVAKDQIKALTLAENPAKRLLRISPGVLRGMYVWEVFYTLPEEGGSERHYYDYYRFSSGEKIETYRLAKPL